MDCVGYDINDVLEGIDASLCSYEQWMHVGMALKHEGLSWFDWDRWSSRDSARYHANECERKWASFSGNDTPITLGTMVQIAKGQGWSPKYDDGHPLEWDDIIGGVDNDAYIDPTWIEGRELNAPGEDWDGTADLIKYLEALFDVNENVGYVCEAYERDGRWLPKKGCYDRTAGQIIEDLSKYNNDIGAVLGDTVGGAGAWIRFNPLDGNGVKDENVTDYRFALVESDSLDIEKQHAIIRELELPVAALVHSGNKSLHAIVRIEAKDMGEYRKRVEYLYSVCDKNGLNLDRQNKNPSRLSRLPGVMRGDQRQYLVDTDFGKKSWTEWYDWIEAVNDDMPNPENLEEVWDDMPDLSAPLIDGILRQGHKMLLSGPSKAGKSFLLIELVIAIANGATWLGHSCAKGKVLYVNLELDRASCLHRFKDVCSKLGIRGDMHNVDVWNLRGHSVPMDRLAPKLIRRASKKGYIAVVIDPIYKVITGDENSANQMAEFCNQFDKVCTELECAVIYCHHHSKGSQGQKRSMDRASGSGVFARDPDTMLDLIELELTDAVIKQRINIAECDEIANILDGFAEGWRDDVSQDACAVSSELREYARANLPTEEMNALIGRCEQLGDTVRMQTAWRVDATLREFAKFPAINIWFSYPVHNLDDTGILAGLESDSDAPPWASRKKRSPEEKKAWREEQRAKREAEQKAERIKKLDEAFEIAKKENNTASKDDIAEYCGVATRTINRWINEHGGFWTNKGEVGRKDVF